MSWKSYREKKVSTLDLAPLGLDGFFVTVRQVKSMTMDEIEGARKAQQEDGTANLEVLRESLGKIIIKWNITDPDNEAVILPLPSIDKDVLKKLPIEVINFIAEEVGKEQKQEVPLEIKTSSEPTSQAPIQA